ncbi:MAG: Crp/Fnr family transcriptional regulator [Alphaproteobacteria bacterium]|nr:Crp/Fnr family transcriptional regulator [Alphaproteobacteria bacterium]
MSDTSVPTLETIKVLESLTEQDRQALESKCTIRRFASGEILVDERTSTNDVFFLVSGRARVVRFTFEKEEVKIATIEAGDTIGHLHAIDGGGRSATVIADRDCVAAGLPAEDFRDLLTKHGAITLNYLRRLAGIVRVLNTRVTAMSALSPDQRVCYELLRLAEPAEGGGYAVKELPSHRELASWANTTREMVAYVIGYLARRGIIERKHKTLYIHDLTALQALVG